MSDKERDPNAYSDEISSVHVPAFQMAREFPRSMAFDILEMQQAADELLIIPGQYQDFAHGISGQLANILHSLAVRCVSYEGAISKKIGEASRACGEIAADLHHRWGEAEHAAHQLQEANAVLRRRVAELEARLQRRLSEHNPKCPEVRAKVLGLTDGKCAYCNTPISDEQGDGTGSFAVEHVVPKSCGGPDHLTNFVPACPRCNSQKHAGHVVEFIRKRVGGA